MRGESAFGAENDSIVVLVLTNKFLFRVLTYSPPVVYSSNTSETYTENIVTLGGFSTVQSWARHFNNLPVPSKLPRGSNYHLFKKGIRPLFEGLRLYLHTFLRESVH